ncbi:ABC transporter substrate-binding protein [Bradyrhizobium sp.]|uniref:ABC transporter substrate-binding protein n=1 Tax=Bradyrhizobium sp. TaxID=376 RepID=UPI001EC49DE4|nr:ABC transporter substrate-binding protein [Bradyrhizobium sp.]MBV9983578.1 ABC transporter substrate-binding protein [Bradyrhizobium sp.]
MRVKTTIAGCVAALLGVLVAVFHGLVAAPAQAADTARQPVAMHLTFDRPLDASMAPFVLAQSHGMFASEGLGVTTDVAQSSAEAIARVASGASEVALVDVNELIRFHDKPDTAPVKAVFMLFNRAPYAVVARKSRGVQRLADVEGKTLGAAESDLSLHLWPAVARLNGIKPASVKLYRMSAAVREPILSAGQVDAVLGFSYLSAVNLRDRGIPASDLAVLRFSDYGGESYGFALIVNPAFAAGKAEAVRGLVRATIAGTHLAIKDPAAAADEVAALIDGGSRELELERLRTVLADDILTDEVRQKGLGGIDPARLDRSIGQIGEDFKFRKRPTPADIFDDSFLPPADGRMIN